MASYILGSGISHGNQIMPETQRYSPDPTLSPVQHHVLSLLAEGVSTTGAAAAAGIHRNTVATWRRTGPAFARELEFAARERSLFWHDQAAALAGKAIAVLNEILDDKTASPALRLRAAFKVIAMASDPQPAPMKPLPASAAQAEACIGQSLLLQTLANESEAQESENMHNSAQPPAEGPSGIEEAVEKPAQNCTVRTNQPGRNSPCPCKSGLKYKRCCANRPSPPLAKAS